MWRGRWGWIVKEAEEMMRRRSREQMIRLQWSAWNRRDLVGLYDRLKSPLNRSSTSLEPHLLALTLTSTHSLLSSLFSLPTHSTPSGPTALLPTPTTLLPREKPLPKPKPLTKWERFAKEKGISHKKREKHEWDEERGEWVARWGRDGKNREKEDQWIHEVKAGEGELRGRRLGTASVFPSSIVGLQSVAHNRRRRLGTCVSRRILRVRLSYSSQSVYLVRRLSPCSLVDPVAFAWP
jgi:hypothetical protein